MPEAVLGVAVLALILALVVVCATKGKYEAAFIGFFVPVVGLVCAIRLAKPGSWWARRRYSDSEMARARTRFPADAEAMDASTRFNVTLAEIRKGEWKGEEVPDRITRATEQQK